MEAKAVRARVSAREVKTAMLVGLILLAVLAAVLTVLAVAVWALIADYDSTAAIGTATESLLRGLMS